MYRSHIPQGVFHSQQPNYIPSNMQSESIPPTKNQAYFPLNYTGIPMHAGSLEKRQKLKAGCACDSSKKAMRRALSVNGGGIHAPGSRSMRGGGLWSSFLSANNKFANAVTGAITPAARTIAPHLGTIGSVTGTLTGVPGLGTLAGLGGNLASQGLAEQTGSGIRRNNKRKMQGGGFWDVVGAIGGLGRHTQSIVPYLGSVGTAAGALTGIPGLGMAGNLAADASMNGLGIRAPGSGIKGGNILGDIFGFGAKKRKNTKSKNKGKGKGKVRVSDSDFAYQKFTKGKGKMKAGNILDDLGSIFG